MAQELIRTALGGPIGDMVAERQETVLLRMLGTEIAEDVSDVGAGTGRPPLPPLLRAVRVG